MTSRNHSGGLSLYNLDLLLIYYIVWAPDYIIIQVMVALRIYVCSLSMTSESLHSKLRACTISFVSHNVSMNMKLQFRVSMDSQVLHVFQEFKFNTLQHILMIRLNGCITNVQHFTFVNIK